MIPINNMTWFPSFRTSVLILLTLIIETGIVWIYCVSQNFDWDITSVLLSLIIIGNIVTGLLGWMFMTIRGG